MTQVALSSSAERAASPPRATRFIASRIYDWAFFLAPPVVALALGALLGLTGVAKERFWIDGHRATYVGIAMGTFINAHLVAVLFRSHANPKVVRKHPLRFFVVPPLLIAALTLSEELMLLSTVLVVFWDVYHSALQTFGLGRIYDARAGNDPNVGRRLDLGLNVVLYIGPILAGASMLDHVGKLADLDDLGTSFFASVPTFMDAEHGRVAIAVLGLSAAFIVHYVLSYGRLARAGYRIAWPKVWLLASTGLCSIITWGFNPWGLAFVVMNLFHAVQYLGLVWFSEGDRLKAMAGLKRLAPFAFLLLVVWYGAWAELVTDEQPLFWAITQSVALLHFWYDGFVWSVSRREI